MSTFIIFWPQDAVFSEREQFCYLLSPVRLSVCHL